MVPHFRESLPGEISSVGVADQVKPELAGKSQLYMSNPNPPQSNLGQISTLNMDTEPNKSEGEEASTLYTLISVSTENRGKP
jgi:hypothetical protein